MQAFSIGQTLINARQRPIIPPRLCLLLRPLPQFPLQLAPVSALAVGALLLGGAAALWCGLVLVLHHCAPGGCRLSSKSRILLSWSLTAV